MLDQNACIGLVVLTAVCASLLGLIHLVLLIDNEYIAMARGHELKVLAAVLVCFLLAFCIADCLQRRKATALAQPLLDSKQDPEAAAGAQAAEPAARGSVAIINTMSDFIRRHAPTGDDIHARSSVFTSQFAFLNRMLPSSSKMLSEDSVPTPK